MPSDRRIIFSSYVSPTQSETMEEDALSRKSFISSPGKSLGGKGTASITATQWNDGWTSMYHPHDNKVTWEQLDDTTDVAGNDWQDEYTTWSGVYVAIAPEQLTPAMDATPLKFLYIRNVEDDDGNNALVRFQSLGYDWDATDDNWDVYVDSFTENFKIKISPGASICLRGDGTLQCDELFVASDSGAGTAIEYIIAK
tara:strand:- start:38 stop:631 length:594 start_codon:yes stop_codon:yes gene_type:complete